MIAATNNPVEDIIQEKVDEAKVLGWPAVVRRAEKRAEREGWDTLVIHCAPSDPCPNITYRGLVDRLYYAWYEHEADMAGCDL